MLKALMLRKKIDDKKKSLDELLEKINGLSTREKELEGAIEEAQTDEEKKVVEENIESFDADKADLEKQKSDLEVEINGLEEDLKGIEEKEPAKEEAGERSKEIVKEERSTIMPLSKFFGMTVQERDAFFALDETKNFVEKVRAAFKDVRSLSNAGLTIPENMLSLIMPIIESNSKLYGVVRVENLKGTAREILMGTIPEAIWTETCANLNELDLGFTDVEVDSFKVGGYFAVCNALLEDNDVNLMQKLLTALGVAIAKALDKAIVYGTGVKMPLGIVTRLAQTSEPSNYSATERPWEDLHSTHVITGQGTTGTSLFKEIITNAKVVINDYYDGEIVWLMNHKTHMDLTVESVGVNAAAAIVSGMNAQMPVIGGRVIELPFIPDGDIVYGYGNAYLLVQRSGIKLSQSEHFMFIGDKTVVKGTARYDGKPVIAEAFAVMHITATTPTTTAAFPEDYANEDMTILTVTAAAGSASGKTVLTVSGMKDSSNNSLAYKVSANVNKLVVGKPAKGYTELTSGTTEIAATAGTPIAVAEIDGSGNVVGAGSALSIPKA